VEILQKVGEKFDVPVGTDIHSAEEAAIRLLSMNVLQIPL